MLLSLPKTGVTLISHSRNPWIRGRCLKSSLFVREATAEHVDIPTFRACCHGISWLYHFSGGFPKKGHHPSIIHFLMGCSIISQAFWIAPCMETRIFTNHPQHNCSCAKSQATAAEDIPRASPADCCSKCRAMCHCRAC